MTSRSTASSHHSSLCKRWHIAIIAAGIIGVGGLTSFAVIGQNAPPNIQKLNIASVPLYAATQGDKPALALALSVEFPTVGAQYVDQPGATVDSSYDSKKEYIGYYNAEMCYAYRDDPSESPASGKSKADYKRFVISGPATNRRCADAFSGNFLNWASNSAVDMLRLALSGGDRVVDTPDLTVLQRAILPDGSLRTTDNGPGCFWNSTNFPAKELKRDNGDYFGAVPKIMRKAAEDKGRNSIWVANKLNQIYFTTAQNSSGDCGSGPATYNLGTAVYQNGMGPISAVSVGDFSAAGLTACSGEHGSCTTNGKLMQVWYGAASTSSYTGGWKTAPVVGSFSCGNATFGDPANGIVKACYLKEYNGSWRPAVKTAGLNSDGFFYSRVEVCNRDGSGGLVDKRDYRFCEKYPSGNFKPIGTIQHYNAQLRLAAFGYAIDNTLSYHNGTDGRYGGVLRAPMKYVGPTTYDQFGQEQGANPRAEWNSQTGVFIENPEADTRFGNSGVINYLNKFGRLLPDKLGNYKRYDPAGELYYETLRYLQGLPPSPAAVSNLTAAMHDGFPIYTDWTDLDPYAGRPNTENYACLKSNIALIGDVNTHDAKTYGKVRMPGVNLANNVPDIQDWVDVVQAFESKRSRSYVDGGGVTRTTNNPNNAAYSGTPAATDRHRSNEIMGLAYWAHTHDIRGTNWTAQPDKQRPGLRVKSFFFDVNEFALEKPEAKRRTNNQYYFAAKYGGFSVQPSSKGDLPYNVQGNPFYDQNGRADNNVWQNPKNQLEPQSYFLQSDARGVLEAFEKIFGDATSSLRNIAGSGVSGNNTTASALFNYQASFDTSGWTGDVQAFAIEKVAGGFKQSETATWSAAQKLSAQSVAARNIFVGIQRTAANPNPPGARATLFTATAIEPALRDMLNRPGAGAAVDNLWKERVEYLRGDRSNEGGHFRTRSHIMGDVVNSGVQYVGVPSFRAALGEGYSQFAADNANRTAAVYVGANDGMLHAFNAKTGEELFAYIPSWMGPKLSALTSTNYTQYTHQSYVDATSATGHAKTGRGTTKDDWKTVLVSGTGGGGKGVFALDITKPDAFDADKVLWEFTHVNDADMGYVIGKPRVVKMQVKHKNTTASPPVARDEYRWFALVPAGANNYVDIGDGIYSKTGNPTLFFLALDKPANEAWELGKNYYKVSLPFDKTLTQSGGSGVVRPTGIISLESYSANARSTIDVVYAGDLHGNVWGLKFTGVDADKWTAGKLSRFNKEEKDAYPMFVAKDSSGVIQPITSAPTILRSGSSNAYLVGFGTGKYIEETDRANTQPNTYYVLYDNGRGDMTSGTPNVQWPVGIAGRGRLEPVMMVGGNLAPRNRNFRFGRPTSDIDNSARAGWYYDLPKTGERIVSDGSPLPYTNTVRVNSLIPAGVSAPGICPVQGGDSDSYSFDYATARGTVRVSPVGLAGQPLLLLDNSELGKADSTGRRLRKVQPYTVHSGTKTSAIEKSAPVYLPVGRLSWRQINNYLELRNRR